MMWDGWGPTENDLAAFELNWKEVRYEATREGLGEDWAIYDIGKTLPFLDKYYDVIIKHCDWYYYWSDTSPWEVIRAVRQPPYPPKETVATKPKFTIEDLNKRLSESRN